MSDYVKVDTGEYLALIQERDNLRKRVAELEAADKWIPCCERLPNPNEHVLVIYDEKDYHERFLAMSHCGDYWIPPFSWVLGRPTHWMPLPEPPSPKGGE